MALRGFIYAFILPFIAFALVAAECDATSISHEEIATACKIQGNPVSERQDQMLLSHIVKAVDEGILVSPNRQNSHSAHSQARERGNAAVSFIEQTKWYFSSASSLCFVPDIRSEIDSFTPIAQLLVFPKHWFW